MSTRSKSTGHFSTCNKINRKRKAEENQWVPSSEASDTPLIVPTPESSLKHSYIASEVVLGSKFRYQNYFTTPIRVKASPLPEVDWADSADVWQVMLRKELTYTRDPDMFDRHPALHARMRAILLDWLIEVCEVYRLLRESLYLATDFLDRFLSKQSHTSKQQLQLIGITCLFIAAKLEEIYPPKIAEFSYVTDGACTEDEILCQELVILKALNWDLSPVTANSWLNVYLQVANTPDIPGGAAQGFVFPQYSSHAFIQIAKLLDLCILDVESLQFQYSVLAAAALYHNSTQELALFVSGYQWSDIFACVQWMTPFAGTVREQGPLAVKFFTNVPSEDSHMIQTHVVDLKLLEKAQVRRDELKYMDHGSPSDIQAQSIIQLTPPSDKKNHVCSDVNCCS